MQEGFVFSTPSPAFTVCEYFWWWPFYWYEAIHIIVVLLWISLIMIWEGLGAGGKGDNRGWDGWMASPTRWTWVWVNSGSWWWIGRPGVLWFMGWQRVRHNWATEMNWIMSNVGLYFFFFPMCLLTICMPSFRKGNGTPLQYSCLENPMGRGAW